MPLYNHTSGPIIGSPKKYPSSSFEPLGFSEIISTAPDDPDLYDRFICINQRFTDIPNHIAWIFEQLCPQHTFLHSYFRTNIFSLHDLWLKMCIEGKTHEDIIQAWSSEIGHFKAELYAKDVIWYWKILYLCAGK